MWGSVYLAHTTTSGHSTRFGSFANQTCPFPLRGYRHSHWWPSEPRELINCCTFPNALQLPLLLPRRGGLLRRFFRPPAVARILDGLTKREVWLQQLLKPWHRASHFDEILRFHRTKKTMEKNKRLSVCLCLIIFLSEIYIEKHAYNFSILLILCASIRKNCKSSLIVIFLAKIFIECTW